MSRANEYLNSFMAGLAYPAMYSQIRGDIDTLEREREYIDGLIAQEQQQLALAEQQFATPAQDLAALNLLVEDYRANQRALGLTEAEIGRIRRGGLSESERRSLNLAISQGAAATSAWIKANAGNLDEAQQATVMEAVMAAPEQRTDRGVGIEPAQKDSLQAVMGQFPARPGDSTAGLSAEAQRLLRERDQLERSMQAIEQAGPTGYRGLAEGQAIAEGRTAEQERLFNDYLTALEDDGQATLEDFAGDADRLAEAADLYREAKTFGAYRNDQRKFFEQSFLDSKARLATLREQADRMARPAGMTRQDEIARRYWEARGYDFDKPYLAQQKEWYYQNLVRGDQMYEAGLEASRRLFEEDPDRFVVPQGYVVMLTPDNEAQRLARDYVAQRFASGERILSMGEARREFRKVLKGDDLDEALAFAHAYNRGLNQNVQTPDDAEREMEQMRAARREQEEAFQRVKQAQQQVREAEDLDREMEAQQQAAVSEFRDQTTASNRALVNLTNALMTRGAAVDGLFPVDERSRLRANREAINQGLNVISDPNLDYETMLKALDQLGFREADLENLATAAGATIRERVRNASPRELVYMNQNPVYAQYIDQNTLQNAQNIMEAQRENAINRVRALEQSREMGVPVRPERRRVPRFRPQEVPAPGEGITTTPIDPTDYMYARDQMTPAYGEARSARIQQQQERVDGLYPPSPPARQPPTITQAQRAVFADLDDDTLRTLANRSIYAAQELAQRGRERQAAPPAGEAEATGSAGPHPPGIQRRIDEANAREAPPAPPPAAPATTPTATPTAQPAEAPAAPAGGGQVQTTGNLRTKYDEILADPNMDLAEKTRRLNAIRDELGRRGTDISRLPPIPTAPAPAPAEQQEADPFARRPGETDEEYFARLEALD